MSDMYTGPARNVRESTDPISPEALWELTLSVPDAGETRVRARLLAQVRPVLENYLRERPGADQFSWVTPLCTVHARRRSGPAGSGFPVRLAFAPDCPPLAAGQAPPHEESGGLTSLRLPDEGARRTGERLVGLDAIRDGILRRWRCQWDGELEGWEGRAGYPVPPALTERLVGSCALAVLAGDPGTGKSALARVACDRYCRDRGVPGTLLIITTEVRGDGMVGNFSRRLWAAFRALASLPAGEFGCLMVDEADAVAMDRGRGQSHQEDTAGSASILQALDALAGTPRRAILMTTNRLDAIDQAVLRRGAVYRFDRPDAAARQALVSPWLPHLGRRELGRAVRDTRGLTPSDIERALSDAWLASLGDGEGPSARRIIACLRGAERTGSV